MFQTAPGQGILGPGKAVGMFAIGFDEAGQPQVPLIPDRQRDVAAFRRGHDAAPRGVVHRCGVDPGAKPHHQHRRIGLTRCFDHRAQELWCDMAQRLTLCLKVVQDRDLGGPSGAGQHGVVDHPAEIGHFSDAVAHRACGCHTSALDRGNSGLGQVAQQNGFQTVKFGIGEFGDRIGADLLAIGEGDPGVGSADIGENGGHLVTSVIAGYGPSKGVIRRFGRAFQCLEIDMDQAEALFIALGPFVIVQKRPVEEAFDIGPAGDGAAGRVQMGKEVLLAHRRRSLRHRPAHRHWPCRFR